MVIRKHRHPKKNQKIQESSDETKDSVFTVPHVQQIFDNIRRNAGLRSFSNSRNALLKWGMITAFALIIVFYLALPVSRIHAVEIKGTEYLNSSYIQKVSGVKENQVFFLTFKPYVQHKLKQDAMIADADVELQDGNTVTITIKEKKAVGYRYDRKPVVLLSDNTTAPLKSDYLDIIAKVPLVTGFDGKEETRLYTKAFRKVKQSVIEDIAEVTQFSLGYDSDAMKILMRNGGYFIGDYQNLDKLNMYQAIYAQMSDKTKCVSGSDDTNYAFTEVCPWNESSAKEYWTDTDGKPVKNQYGDKVVKRYYTDKDGKEATDASGNKIAIPIDENGVEHPDQDFLAHYEAGYYASGTLVIPDTGDAAVTEESDDSE